MAIDVHQGIGDFVYTADDTKKYKIRMGKNKAASAGFTAATTEPRLPAGMKPRHIDWVSNAAGPTGNKQRETCPWPTPTGLYLTGGNFNYEGVAGRVTGAIGEKRRF